jgi:hypothetical protein
VRTSASAVSVSRTELVRSSELICPCDLSTAFLIFLAKHSLRIRQQLKDNNSRLRRTTVVKSLMFALVCSRHPECCNFMRSAWQRSCALSANRRSRCHDMRGDSKPHCPEIAIVELCKYLQHSCKAACLIVANALPYSPVRRARTTQLRVYRAPNLGEPCR